MTSWPCAIGGLLAVLFCLNVQAAPVHETARLSRDFINHGWIGELYQPESELTVAPLAYEEFQNIPRGRSVSLQFVALERDLVDVMINKRDGVSAQFSNEWIGYLFNLRAWEIDEDNKFFTLSAHARPVIPLPAALPLFFTALAALCMALVFLNWRRGRR